MLALGANIHAVTSDNWTALLKASCGGNTDLVIKLLNLPGINSTLHVTTDKGLTALHVASPYPACTEVLLAAGIDPNIKDAQGESSLMRAAASNQPDALESMVKLIHAGAQVNAVDNMGRTPLLHAFSSSNPEAKIEFLINKGGNIHIADAQGWNALLLAVRKDEEWALRVLLAAKADPTSCLLNGSSALDLAMASNNSSILTLLQNEIIQREVGSPPILTAQPISGDKTFSAVENGSLQGENGNANNQGNANPAGPHLVCGICLEIMGDTSLGLSQMIASKLCGHIFCENCWSGVMNLKERMPSCPMCRQPSDGKLRKEDLIRLYT